jgi:hypothetical protein
MKKLLIISLLSVFMSPAFANTAVKLSCHLRKIVIISRFQYQLSTMKWDDQFQVASGIKKSQTKDHASVFSTFFLNGDVLVFFPESKKYFFLYSGDKTPDRCVVLAHYTYPVIQLPYFKEPRS